VLAAKRWPLHTNDAHISWLSQFLGGAWIALMGFNVLPSVLISLSLAMNALPVCGRDRFRWVPVLQLCGAMAGVAVFGFNWQPEPTLLIVMCSLPLMMYQPWMVMVVALKTFQQLRDRHDELQHLSRHDGLSGLLNRAHWEEQVRSAFSRRDTTTRPVVLVMADLDHFKRINDRYGHAAGDEAIRRFASTLKGLLRSSDVCGRYGGEEFGVLMPGTSEDEAAKVLERVRQALHEAPLLDGEAVTASFGLAVLGPDVACVDSWLRLADQRLYQAKHLGRNRIKTSDSLAQ
jgi:diguanylate cyclase (GGDEF)-like protein